MNWIKVENEKPSYDFEVIVCSKRGMITTAYLIENKGEDIFVAFEGVVEKDITHWMPLPYPPKDVRESMFK